MKRNFLSKGLAEPQARTAVKVFQSLTYKSHRGPLPPAEEFAGYEAVFPGAAKEILDMAVRSRNMHTGAKGLPYKAR